MQVDSWSCQRRVFGRAEWTQGEANPRFIVTSLSRAEAGARHFYEKICCAQGDWGGATSALWNRIKECRLDLFAA